MQTITFDEKVLAKVISSVKAGVASLEAHNYTGDDDDYIDRVEKAMGNAIRTLEELKDGKPLTQPEPLPPWN